MQLKLQGAAKSDQTHVLVIFTSETYIFELQIDLLAMEL
jgi:hypothetical protein